MTLSSVPYLNVGLMAQGTDEASTLLERVKFLWDNLSDAVKAFAGVKLDKNNTKEFAFNNNSTIFIRVSFRSTTLQRLHVSEMGKIANQYPQRAKEVKTGTLQALARGNTGVIESTAEGRNAFKELWDASVISEASGQLSYKDFRPIFLSWLDDPDCVETIDQVEDESAIKYFNELEVATGRKLTKEQRNFWVVQRRELGGDIFQEYPATPDEAFTASRDGTYYSKQFTELVRAGRVVRELYDKNLDTDVYFDLGVDDYTVLALTQRHRSERRLVGEYWNNGYSIGHYLAYLKDLELPIRELVLPHDANNRTIASEGEGRAKSTYDIVVEWIRDNDVPWRVRVLAKASIESGIQAVRAMLPSLYVDPCCSYLIDCFHNYSKEWDDKLQVWKKTPLHDEYSHGADVIRQIAVDDSVTPRRTEPRRRMSGHAV